MLKMARRFLADRAYRDAHAACMTALQSDPTCGEAVFLLGILTADHNNHGKAIELFDRALSADYQAAEVHAQKARSLLALNKKDLAVSVAEEAIHANPQDAYSLDTIGVVLSRAGLHERAVSFYQSATEKAPGEASYFYNLGAAQQFMGHFDDARTAFDRALEIDPSLSKARVARVSITKQTQDANDLEALRAAWSARDVQNVDETLQLAHALAKTEEDLANPAGAMAWLEKGKSAKRATLPDRAEEDRACFGAAARLGQTLNIASGTKADGPVFIVGMPRTGTTLADRIISSHSSMTAAGELSDFSVLLKRATKTPGNLVLDPPTLDAATRVDLSEIGRAYRQSVSDALGIQGRFTDKMPLNLFFAPAILSALPGSRVICLRRHPADTLLSNYRQLFATSFSYYRYAYDLKDTARYVVEFNRLIAAYADILPADRFTIVDYEQLVDQTEPEARRLLAHSGLEFEEDCLNFHKSAAPVATASASQVRQPIYRTSLNRWKSYRPMVDEALDILVTEGLMVPSELD